MSQSAIITVMERACRKAAPRLRRDFGEVSQLQVLRKGPADFVSQADKAAERTLLEELQKARPGWGFLLEEGGEIPGEEENFKITGVGDLARARRRLEAQMDIRTGTGCDVHAFGPGAALSRAKHPAGPNEGPAADTKTGTPGASAPGSAEFVHRPARPADRPQLRPFLLGRGPPRPRGGARCLSARHHLPRPCRPRSHRLPPVRQGRPRVGSG